MNFPSTEFDDAVAELCQGTATDGDIAKVHAVLRRDWAARDDYLWQVELHSRLAQMSYPSTPGEAIVVIREAGRNGRRLPTVNGRRHIHGALVAALLMIVVGGLFWAGWDWRGLQRRIAATHAGKTTVQSTQAFTLPIPEGGTAMNPGARTGGVSMEGIYRENVRFAFASNAPVIVGTGGAEPVELGAQVPYSQGGDTLHIWDWPKSTTSRVMKDTRLWPTDVFAVSHDGKTLVWASGRILDLTSGQSSKIDLGGDLYPDNIGGELQRIQELQFTPDGGHLALRLCNIVLTKSSHPLRKQDFSTTRSIQIVTFPGAGQICEFPAGRSLAFSPDGTRAVTSLPEDQLNQQIVEYSATTGEVVRKYEPRMNDAARLALDATTLAAFDSAGEILIWDSATGKLKHRIHLTEGQPGDLRFSPDGKHLAVSLLKKTSVIDVASGAIVGAVAQEIPGIIHWSPDGTAFDVITNYHYSERPDKAGHETLYNVFPAVKHWKMDELEKK